MKDAGVGKAFGIIMAVFGIIIMLAMCLYNYFSNVNTVIKGKTTEFVQICSSTGKIDADNYLEFCNSIYKLGNYDIKISYEEQKDFYNNDEWRRENITVSEDEILSKMFPENKKKQYNYNLTKNGHFTVSVVQRTPNMAQQLFNGLFVSNTGENDLIVRYGEDVGHTGTGK